MKKDLLSVTVPSNISTLADIETHANSKLKLQSSKWYKIDMDKVNDLHDNEAKLNALFKIFEMMNFNVTDYVLNRDIKDFMKEV